MVVIQVILRMVGGFHVSVVLPLRHNSTHHNPKVIRTTKCEVWKYSNIAMAIPINFSI